MEMNMKKEIKLNENELKQLKTSYEILKKMTDNMRKGLEDHFLEDIILSNTEDYAFIKGIDLRRAVRLLDYLTYCDCQTWSVDVLDE